MIAEKFIDRFARNSGIKDKFIAEREVVLTYALRVLHGSDVMKHLAFKGGTALRKLVFGSSGRFSMDLDLTLCAAKTESDEVLQSVLEAFNRQHHGITFKSDDFYVTDEDTSFGGDIQYKHAWNSAGMFKLQISLREVPTLPVLPTAMLPQEYFKEMEFEPFDIRAVATIEMIAEKIRAAFQRSKVRDLYDLNRFAATPFNADLLRGLVVLKLWQSKDPFDPDVFFKKLRGANYDWEDLHRLIRISEKTVPEDIIASVEKRYMPLKHLTELELQVIADSKSGRNTPLANQLRKQIMELIENEPQKGAKRL